VFNYIDYDTLKEALRAPRNWDHDTEQSFVVQLDKELDKVYTFQQVKAEEIIRRIAASEKEVTACVARLEADGRNGEERPTEEDFELLEEDVSDIIADVHDLAKFTQLNYTGFQKIIKKHDVGSPALYTMPLLTCLLNRKLQA
jgi:SPX domain protein involved in polyphosphate accumulation